MYQRSNNFKKKFVKILELLKAYMKKKAKILASLQND